jgi:hypothetical protein
LGTGQRAEIEKVAVAAVVALGLDFGAVDILAKYPKGDLTRSPVLAVCEVNTAPGLANETTLQAYTKAITDYYHSTRDSRFVNTPVVRRRKRVRKSVLVWITTKKGNRVQRMRDRWVYE